MKTRKSKKSNRQRHAWLCAMVAGALLTQCPGVSYAEEVYALDQVVVTASRVPSKISQAAANITVISREQIEYGHYSSLVDVLKQANGVDIRQQGFPGGEDYVRLNGDERVLILIDGRRMNLNKKTGHGQATYNLNVFPSLSNIERIEIVKGAASAIYGSDAVGGVVNIITRQGGANQSTFEVGAGSWGTEKYEFTTEGGENGWNWLVTAGKKEQDHYSYKDFKTGVVKDMPNSAYDQKNMTLRIDKELSNSSSLTFTMEHADDHKGQPGSAIDTNSNAYLDTLTNNWDLTYHMDKSTEASNYLRLYQNYHKYDWNNPTSSYNANTNYNNKETGFAWQDHWRLDENNILVGGIEWRETKVQSSEFGDRKLTNKAAYLEERMQLGDKWVLTPGLRYDNHSNFGSKTTPRASINYEINKTTDMYVSWGKVFNAPLVDDLFWPEEIYPGYHAMGNPNLKPETGDTTTIGINKQFDEKTHMKVSYFQSRLHDAIDWDENAGLWTPSNVDEMRKKGVDIEVRRTMSPAWSITAGYSYIKSEEKTDTGYSLQEDIVQPNGYRIGANYTSGKWNVNANGTGATGRNTKQFSSSHYWIVDLALDYSMDKNTRAYFKVNNLTNEAYELVGSGDYNPIGSFPMAARNYQFGVKYLY